MPDHHLPLAKFVQNYHVPGFPVDVEAMLAKAGVDVVTYVGQSVNGATLTEHNGGMTMRISTARRYIMSTATRRLFVARAFALFLSGQPGPVWKVTDNDMGSSHNDPHEIFSHRFAGELLIPEGELREVLKSVMPCVERIAWTKVAGHFDVPLMYAIQRVNVLKFKVGQKS